jgi:NitT/TauT family transport system ATP-binding protein
MQRVASVTAAPRHVVAPAVEVRNPTHDYHGRDGAVRALAAIDLSIGRGRFTVIVGPSGCGKTSLLLMIAGLRHQSTG